MKSQVTALYDIDKIAVPAELCVWRVDEAETDARVSALAMEYAAETAVETAAEGDRVICRGAENSPLADRTVLIFPGRAISGAEEAERAVVGKKVGEQAAMTLAGAETVLTIEEILRRQPAAVDDELIQKQEIDGVTTVAGYRAYFRNQREQSNRDMAVRQISSHLFQELAERSDFDIDRGEMDAWTGKRAALMFRYMLEEGEDPRLPEEGFEILTDEQAIAKIAESLESQFKETLVCRALCRQNGICFTAEDIQSELEQIRAAEGTEAVDEEQLLENKYFFELWTILENRAKTFWEGEQWRSLKQRQPPLTN